MRGWIVPDIGSNRTSHGSIGRLHVGDGLLLDGARCLDAAVDQLGQDGSWLTLGGADQLRQSGDRLESLVRAVYLPNTELGRRGGGRHPDGVLPRAGGHRGIVGHHLTQGRGCGEHEVVAEAGNRFWGWVDWVIFKDFLIP